MLWKRIMVSVLPLAGLALVPSMASAEAYLRLGVTPSMGAASADGSPNVTATADTETQESVGLSLGKGIGLDAAIGTELAPHFAVELGVGYLFGLKNEMSQTTAGGGSSSLYTQEATGNLLRITPAVVISTQLGKVRAYSRFGLVIGIASATMHRTDSKTSPSKIETAEDEEQYSGGVALGVLGALGGEVGLSGKLSLFGEINYTGMSWSPSHSEVTLNMSDGKDKLPDMKVRDKQTDYVSPLTRRSSDTPDDSKPREQLAFHLPFSNLGLQIGVRLGF